MFNQFLAWVLVSSFYTITMVQVMSSGGQATVDGARIGQSILANIRSLVMQHCSSSRQATVDEVRIGQSILANIRSLVMQHCSCEAPTDNSSNNLLSETQSLTKHILVIEKSHGCNNSSDILSSGIQNVISHFIANITETISSEFQNLAKRVEAIENSHDCDCRSDIPSSEIQNITKRIMATEISNAKDNTSDSHSCDIQNLTKRIETMEKSVGADSTSDILLSGIQNLTTRIEAMERLSLKFKNSQNEWKLRKYRPSPRVSWRWTNRTGWTIYPTYFRRKS